MLERIKELYAYREMIASLVKRDLKGRYKGSALGFLWTFLNPQMMTLHKVVHQGEEFSLARSKHVHFC